MTGYQGKAWLRVEVYGDGTQLDCRCLRCGEHTTAEGAPEAVEGVQDRFIRVHGSCSERKGRARSA